MGHKELDTTEWLNKKKNSNLKFMKVFKIHSQKYYECDTWLKLKRNVKVAKFYKNTNLKPIYIILHFQKIFIYLHFLEYQQIF